MGTGFGIGQGVMVVPQVKSAISGNRVQLVVGELLEKPLGGLAGAIEPVIGIIHLVSAKDGLQATLIK